MMYVIMIVLQTALNPHMVQKGDWDHAKPSRKKSIKSDKPNTPTCNPVSMKHIVPVTETSMV